MSVQQYLDRMVKIQSDLLEFLENENSYEESFQNLSITFEDQKISENQHELKSFLQMLGQISNYHQRGPNFFHKIEKILQFFKNEIINYYTNREIFQIFKDNKRILLFLLEESILKIDKFIFNQFFNKKYRMANYFQYFSPELRAIKGERWASREKGKDNFFPFGSRKFEWKEEIEKELPENFYENRKIGENENKICQLIRKDLIKEFIAYINQNNIYLNINIEPSIFETNLFLIEKSIEAEESNRFNSREHKQISLIKYAAFFGSIQIFNYLVSNKVSMSFDLWFYAIHGQNAEIIHQIEEQNNFYPGFEKKLIKEAIKFNHNDMVNYFINNCPTNETKNDLISNENYNTVKSLEYYNFAFMQAEFINDSVFLDLCKFDYYLLVEILMKKNSIDINKTFKILVFYF